MSAVGFDDQGRSERLDAAAARAAGRTGRSDDKSIAGSRGTWLALGLAGGFSMLGVAGFCFGVGQNLLGGVFAVTAGLFGAAAAIGARVTGGPGRAIAPLSGSGDRRLEAAYETARDAVFGSPGVEDTTKVELTAALKAALDETLRAEEQRDGLMAALNNLPDRGSDAGARLEKALTELDGRRDEFLAQCASVQASVATLAIGTDKGRALAELQAAVGGLKSHAAAERELAEALAAPRARVPERQ